MDVCIVGATGAIGRAVAARLVSTRVLNHDEQLQLVGSPRAQSQMRLRGFVEDLYDGYAESCPMIKAVQPQDITAEIVVFCAGEPTSERNQQRHDLAEANTGLFEEYSQAFNANDAIRLLIDVSNPVELAVSTFCEHITEETPLSRHRIIGMGAHLDSRRFRHEIAKDLSDQYDVNVRRQHVQCYMAGEHGQCMVPLWSQLKVYGDVKVCEAAKDLRDEAISYRKGRRFDEVFREVWEDVDQLRRQQDVKGVFDYVARLPADLRTIIKARVITIAGAKTAFATSAATVDLINGIANGDERVVSVQVKVLNTDCFHGVNTVIGRPVSLSFEGWSDDRSIELDGREIEELRYAWQQVDNNLREWTSTERVQAGAPDVGPEEPSREKVPTDSQSE